MRGAVDGAVVCEDDVGEVCGADGVELDGFDFCRVC